mgnify:CR=1 FL=1
MTMRTFRSSRPRHNQGFTLVEISIVLVIIGLILGGILNAQSVIRNAQTKDSIKALNDMSAAARQFFDRYGMWPGDFSNAVASGLVCANGESFALDRSKFPTGARTAAKLTKNKAAKFDKVSAKIIDKVTKATGGSLRS